VSVYVFTGPTLRPDEACAELDAIYLPPVSQGDVSRVVLRRPRAIGIIDGYFECVPAVWHKEILWAMTQGIHVYGSASMGALRAAELSAFGMVGVGKIFAAYRDGRLEDDDEVAVAHGPGETGYRSLSVAMVNIRFTLAAAMKAKVISRRTAATLERIGKGMFYPERSYPPILNAAAREGMPASELCALRAWLPRGEVNQKRLDGLAMLRRIRTHLGKKAEPKRVLYRFEHTEAWDHAWRRAGELALDGDGSSDAVGLERLLDELRLEGETYTRARQGALLRFLALEEAWRLGMAVSAEKLDAATDAFRHGHGLHEAVDVERFVREQGLDQGRFTRLMEEEAQRHEVESVAEEEITSHLPDHLRASGEYGRLLSRARDKQRVLESSGLGNPDLADSGLMEEQLLAWYFETRLGRGLVSDAEQYALSVGFEDKAAFRRAILREYLYSVRRG